VAQISVREALPAIAHRVTSDVVIEKFKLEYYQKNGKKQDSPQ
jgi:hypothetical protein